MRYYENFFHQNKLEEKERNHLEDMSIFDNTTNRQGFLHSLGSYIPPVLFFNTKVKGLQFVLVYTLVADLNVDAQGRRARMKLNNDPLMVSWFPGTAAMSKNIPCRKSRRETL